MILRSEMDYETNNFWFAIRDITVA